MKRSRWQIINPGAAEELPVTWLAAIFLLALAYRGLCYGVLASQVLFSQPVVDAAQHWAWAKRIVAGDLWGHGVDDVFKPPCYPYFLALVALFGGCRLPVVWWCQYVLGAVSCVLTALVAARLLGRRVGLAAGVLSALYAPYVFFETQLLSPPLSICLNLLYLWLLLPGPPGPPVWRWLAAGAVLGLSAWVRPDILLPGGLVALVLLKHYPAAGCSLRAKWALGLTVGVVSALLPVTLRNARLSGEFIPVASYGGINFYTGNSLAADGFSAVPVGLRWERLIFRVPQDILAHPAQAGRFWRRQAWREMASAPGRTIKNLARKAVGFFNRREFRNNICYHYLQAQAWPLRWPFVQFSLIWPLAAAGLAAMWRQPAGRAILARRLILVWVLAFWAAAVGFFVTARYRLPMLPLVMAAAAYALVQGWDFLRARRFKELACYGGVFLAAGVLSWPWWFGRPEPAWVQDYLNEGNARLAAGDEPGALQAFQRALGIREDADAHFLLARIFLSRQEVSRAREHLAAARRLLPASPDLLLASAQASLAAQARPEAQEFLEQLLALARQGNLWPRRREWTLAHLLLAELKPAAAGDLRERAWAIHPPTAAEYFFLRRQELPRVVAAFRQEAEARPWDWYAQANYGLALLSTGQPEDSLKPLGRAVRLAPEKDGLCFQWAQALAQAGRRDEARKTLDELLTRLPDGPLRRAAQQLKAKLP